MNRSNAEPRRHPGGLRPSARCLAPLAVMVALGGTLVAPDAALADEADDARAQRRKAIADMPEAQRAALKRNWETFRKLPPAEQEKLRRLDRELKDDTRNQGQLNKVMRDYLAWLETLDSVGQAEDLRREPSPDKREKLVRELMAEQRKRSDPFSPRKLNGGFGPLAANDLEAITGVVERQMREQHVRIGALEDASKKTGLARSAAVLDLAFARPGPGNEGNALMVSPEMFDEIVGVVNNANQKKWVEDAAPQDRQRRLYGLISSGVMSEFDKIKPDESTLHAYFATMKAEQQQELLSLPGRWQEFELMRRYMEANPDLPKPPQFGRWYGWFGGGFGRGNNGPRFEGRRNENMPQSQLGNGPADAKRPAPNSGADDILAEPPRGKAPGGQRRKNQRGGPMG